jgi:hypothetical protein
MILEALCEWREEERDGRDPEERAIEKSALSTMRARREKRTERDPLRLLFYSLCGSASNRAVSSLGERIC